MFYLSTMTKTKKQNPWFKQLSMFVAGVVLATSVGIFAAEPSTTSIQANLVNLIQYLKELRITDTGTPDGVTLMTVNQNGSSALLALESTDR